MIEHLLVVWTAASVVTAIVGGFALGLVVVARFENPRFDAIESGGVMVLLGILAGAVFFIGQAIEALSSDGPQFAWRVVSRFGLWGVFTLAMGAGTALGIRFRRGLWR